MEPKSRIDYILSHRVNVASITVQRPPARLVSERLEERGGVREPGFRLFSSDHRFLLAVVDKFPT